MSTPIYKQLKLSKNGMPTWDSLLPYVLNYLVERNVKVPRIEILVDVANSLDLPEELRNLTYDSGKNSKVIEDRLGFTVSALKISGLIETVARGVYKATPLGVQYWKRYGCGLDLNLVNSTEESIKYYNELEKNKIDSEPEKTDSYNMIESISDQIDKLKKEKQHELLNAILDSSPYLFERLVVELLSKMGYKGKKGTSIVTQKSNDGGIDGIINQDPLGTQTVYIQAKRYSKNNVQRPEIEQFYGAFTRENAHRGVFITTSEFSQTAKHTAEKMSIILIDKHQLLDLLIEYEIGVEIDRSYYTYKLDEDFFESLDLNSIESTHT